MYLLDYIHQNHKWSDLQLHRQQKMYDHDMHQPDKRTLTHPDPFDSTSEPKPKKRVNQTKHRLSTLHVLANITTDVAKKESISTAAPHMQAESH